MCFRIDESVESVEKMENMSKRYSFDRDAIVHGCGETMRFLNFHSLVSCWTSPQQMDARRAVKRTLSLASAVERYVSRNERALSTVNDEL